MARYSVVLFLVLVGVFGLGCKKQEPAPTPPAADGGTTATFGDQKMPNGETIHQ